MDFEYCLEYIDKRNQIEICDNTRDENVSCDFVEYYSSEYLSCRKQTMRRDCLNSRIYCTSAHWANIQMERVPYCCKSNKNVESIDK